jgi:hypothetical protein
MDPAHQDHPRSKENIVRKILTTLVALVAFAALSGVASADVPNPSYTPNHSPSMDLGQTCSTPWTSGVFGQYGAAGFFVDGCTATVRCPSYTRGCNVYGTGTIGEAGYLYDSMNARLRMFDSHGSIIGWKDVSCYHSYRGCTTPQLAGTLGPGGIGTVQCNGVRLSTTSQLPYGSAIDTCRVELFENFV